jgi:HK97 family phage portal protein
MEFRGFAQWMRHAKATPAAQQKAAESWLWPRMLGSWILSPSRSRYHYAADVSDGLDSSSVMACVQWIMRAFPEAQLVVEERQRDEVTQLHEHPLAVLVRQPNPFYSGAQLWMATVANWCWGGEAYWRVISDRGGRPAELWWVPPWSIEPKWPADGSVYISHYTYQPEMGTSISLAPEEVVHFRHGMDPRNPRHGLPPLRSVIKEIWADDEASIWVASLLRNMAVPGLIISPKGDVSVSPDDLEAVKVYLKQAFTGDGRGEPLALQAPIDVQKLSLSPHEMDMSMVRDTTEERVSACLGIPSAVIGFGTGLATTKVGATMREMVQLAWNNGLIPPQRIMAAELGRTLLPLFETSPEHYQVAWDYSKVQALQEDVNAKATRIVGLVTGGIMKVSEGRTEMGLEATPDDEIYLRPSSLTPIDPTDQLPEPEPMPPALLPMNGNGNGNGNGAQNGNDHRNGNRARGEHRALDIPGAKQSREEFLTGFIASHAPRIETPPARLTALINTLFRHERSLEARTAVKIANVLRAFGATMAAKAEGFYNRKMDLQSMVEAAFILERGDTVQLTADLTRIYEAFSAEMAALVIKAMQSALTMEDVNVDRLVASVKASAQRRIEVLNLPTELRATLERLIDEGRAESWIPSELAKRIETDLPAGRWKSIEMRAQTIAITELRFAMNTTTLGVARAMGINRVLCFDARLGPTDETCTIRNGLVLTTGTAEVILPTEHPRGTISFMPLSPSMMEQLAVVG